MGLSIDQLKPIKKEFQQKYFFSDPYTQYVNGCGISNLRVRQEIKKDQLELRDGESLDDLCLSVMFKTEPPKDLEFPSEYRGVRVFYEVVGEIRAL